MKMVTIVRIPPHDNLRGVDLEAEARRLQQIGLNAYDRGPTLF